MPETLTSPPTTRRGAGAICACGNHRRRCNIGHSHSWSTWYDNGRLMRTTDTYKCLGCGGVCTLDEAA